MTQAVSAVLFGRFARITVGQIQTTWSGATGGGLDLWFQAKRNLKPKEPNTCNLKLWNLAPASRQAIESYTSTSFQAGGAPPGLGQNVVPVKIEAGYVGNFSTVFLGNMRSAHTVRDGTDLITELDTGDSDEAMLLARTSSAFGTGANAYTVAMSIIQNDMGIGVGNIATVQSILMASPMFKSGGIVKGRSMVHLSDIATSCGLEVSIQGGATQWLTAGRPLGGQAYNLASAPQNTGLIGSPTVDTKGILHAESLLIPGLVPGNPIQINGEFVTGWFRVLSTEVVCETAGGPSGAWKIGIEAGRMQQGPNVAWQGIAP